MAGSVWEFGVLLCKPAFIALVTCEPSPGGADKMKAAACMAECRRLLPTRAQFILSAREN